MGIKKERSRHGVGRVGDNSEVHDLVNGMKCNNITLNNNRKKLIQNSVFY